MILFFVFSSEMPKHDKACILENNMENILYGERNMTNKKIKVVYLLCL